MQLRMTIIACSLLLSGCTFSRNGSQAIDFNPFAAFGEMLSPATDADHIDGDRWNYRK